MGGRAGGGARSGGGGAGGATKQASASLGGVRVKTPAQLEQQYSRLTMQNYQNGDNLQKSIRITNAAKAARKKLGYESTGKMTKNLDHIYRKNNGKLFTIQNGKEVAYKGNKVK